ncbi:hypothetical protein VHUM_03898 [Vanrija humicola]|uniref:Uncharacterized protein n=1 Tax=Vanrija humicola TaxID=5417 RepID=A0A7D8YVA2_VANHU|nr:hypothetical protein VHUM_03898 [Vanrija humicola]
MKRYIPFDQRKHRAYVLAKYTHFFNEGQHEAKDIPHDFFQRATDELRQRWPDFEIVGAITDNRSEQEQKEKPHVIPSGIRNFGKLGPAELAHSRLLLGIGLPGLSPSPWRGLTMGLPFLNPGHSGGRQHNTIAKLGEP